MNTKHLLAASVVGTLLFFAILGFFQLGYCRGTEWCVGATQDILSAAPGYLSIFVATLVIAVVSYVLKTEISRNFVLFTVVWVAFSIFAGLTFGQSSGGWISSSPNPEGIFFLLVVVYALIGLVWQTRFYLTRG